MTIGRKAIPPCSLACKTSNYIVHVLPSGQVTIITTCDNASALWRQIVLTALALPNRLYFLPEQRLLRAHTHI
jgi:hypothetical protein